DGHFGFHLVVGGTGNGNATGTGHPLQPVCDVDAVTVAVPIFGDDVAEIDAHARVDAAVGTEPAVAFFQRALPGDGALNGIYDARELGQHTVAHQLEDSVVMLCYFRFEQFLAMSAQTLEGVRLVLFHEAAVADDIDGKNGGEPTFHASASPHEETS